MRRTEFAAKVSAFHQKNKRAIYLIIYLVLGAFATWEWQKSAERDLECRFDKLNNRIGQLEAILVSQNLRTEQTLLTALQIAKSLDSKYIEDVKKINDKFLDSTDVYHDNIEKTQSEIDDICDDLNGIGWSFLAISLFAGLVITILSPSDKDKTPKIGRTKGSKRG